MTWAIHGFTGSTGFWAQLATIPAAQCLSVLGHGPSSIASGGESFDCEVTRLSAKLPKSGVHLIGYSLGARLALAIALQAPSRVAKLTLIGVHPGLQLESERVLRRKADQEWARLLRSEGIEAFVDAWQALPMWASQKRLMPALQKGQREARLQHHAEQLAFALEALGTGSMSPMWNDLGKLTMPVQLIVGALDAKYLALAKQMLTHLPNAHLDLVAGAGHNPVLEQAEALARLLDLETSPSRAAQ